MKNILLYNLFPINHWQSLTEELLGNVPHEDIVIHVSLRKIDKVLGKEKKVLEFLKKYTSEEKIFFSLNNKKLGEVQGFEVFRKNIDFSNYKILTYLHSKGVTKPENENIKDWVRMMHYFMIERFDLIEKVFEEGYKVYGANLFFREEITSKVPDVFYEIPFSFSGNFASVNLQAVLEKFLSVKIEQNYYGVEAFWGKLCKKEEAYSPHRAEINLYDNPYPPKLYRNS